MAEVWKEQENESGLERLIRKTVFSLFARTATLFFFSAIPLACLYVVLRMDGSNDFPLLEACKIYLDFVLLLFSVWAVFYLKNDIRSKSFPIEIKKIILGFAFSAFAIIGTFQFFVTLGHFSAHIYERVPSQFGGGYPIRAKFIVALHDIGYLELLEISGKRSRQESKTLRILYEGESFYVIDSPDSPRQTIKLNKELVQALRIHY